MMYLYVCLKGRLLGMLHWRSASSISLVGNNDDNNKKKKTIHYNFMIQSYT